MSFKQKGHKNDFPSKPKDALSAADHFCRMQCSNTDIITKWLMITAKAGKLFILSNVIKCHCWLIQIICN